MGQIKQGDNYTKQTLHVSFLSPELPSFRSTPGRHPGGVGVSRSYTKLPSLRHTPRQVRQTSLFLNCRLCIYDIIKSKANLKQNDCYRISDKNSTETRCFFSLICHRF